jgi:prepilin-type N-terminal cleavage/methylation domain-containing protein
MLPLSTNAPAFRRGACSTAPNRGFTLIELLTVIAIIGLLAAMTLGIVSGVNSRAAMGQAKSELATLSQALESYKRQYGDYPQTNDPKALLNALVGKRGPRYDAALNGMTGKNFLELSKFTLVDSTNPSVANPDPLTSTSVTLQDPWGTDYYYTYKPTSALASTWTHSYVLYSKGPPNSINNQSPSSGADVTTDSTGLPDIFDSAGQLKSPFFNYIFANQ